MKQVMFSALALALVCTSCKKNKGDETPIAADAIIGDYKITAVDYSTVGPVINGLDFIPACERDDLFMFKAGNVLHHADAGTACDPSGNYDATWTVKGDSIFIDGRLPEKIVSLTSSTLKTSSTISALGVSATTSTTFTRQ